MSSRNGAIFIQSLGNLNGKHFAHKMVHGLKWKWPHMSTLGCWFERLREGECLCSDN